ncbi:MAG: hypothetical protein Q8882_08990 [Bacillota bacterium]|nr:hypothetical protein [Bacillota bacterium]
MAMLDISPPEELSGDLKKDVASLKDYVTRLYKEMEYILMNLDEENVSSAGSVAAENINTTNAKITSSQIKSLSADKINTGTLLVSGNMAVENDSGSVSITSTGLTVSDTDMTLINSGSTLKTIISNDGIQISGKVGTIYKPVFGVDGNGNLTISGTFSTDTSGYQRAVLDDDGLYFEDSGRDKQGWALESDDLGGNMVLYKNGTAKVAMGFDPLNSSYPELLIDACTSSDPQSLRIEAGYRIRINGDYIYLNGANQVIVNADDIYLNGSVHVDGSLDVGGNIVLTV